MRIIAVLVGLLLTFIGGVVLVLSAMGLWAVGWDSTLDGTTRLDTPTAALASGTTDLGGDWLTDWPPNDTDKAKLTLDATSRNGQGLFVGIGHTTDVEGFLADKPWGEITVFSDDPSDSDDDVEVKERGSGDPAALPAPADQTFWIAQAGPGEKVDLEWDLRSGENTLVLMNADGSPAVDADTSFELHVPRLNVVLLVGIVIGAIVLLIGLALMVKGSRDRNEAMPSMP